MSFIVKGIDLPKKVDHITLNVYADGTIERVNMTEIIFEKEAQAIQIPTPHGRLIDADMVFTFDHRAEEQLKEVPTILEAEE